VCGRNQGQKHCEIPANSKNLTVSTITAALFQSKKVSLPNNFEPGPYYYTVMDGGRTKQAQDAADFGATSTKTDRIQDESGHIEIF
jgi:hypothetical protein